MPAVSCFGFWKPPTSTYWKLVKELLIHLLYGQAFLDPAPDTVMDHQAGELLAIDEYDSLAQVFGCLAV
jgi:hypothetical protein